METNLDWSNLSFGYMKTHYNVRCTFKDGKWGEIEVTDSERVDLHMAATCLHYGQEIFEGLKAFRGKDGKIRIFRLEENAKRIQRSAEGILMEPLPVEKFREMVEKVVRLNQDFIPPYGSGSSLYIRPLELGMSAQVGVKPATEYLFLIFVTPVGPYFKEGFKPFRISRKASNPPRWQFIASSTVLHHVVPDVGRWAATMQPASLPALWLRRAAIRLCFISTRRKRNISTNVVRQTSLL